MGHRKEEMGIGDRKGDALKGRREEMKGRREEGRARENAKTGIGRQTRKNGKWVPPKGVGVVAEPNPGEVEDWK